MITEILMTEFLQSNFRLNSNNCITYLYVDVKEPTPLQRRCCLELKESLLLQTKLGNITVDYDVNLLQPTQLDMGLTGFEPVTLRLSSACSNQLSYRPGSLLNQPTNPRIHIGGGMGIRTPDL